MSGDSLPGSEEKRKNREADVVLREVSNPVNPGNNSSLV